MSDCSWMVQRAELISLTVAVVFQTIHIVSSFVSRGGKKKKKKTLVSKESGQVDANKSVVQYKQSLIV